MTLTRLIDAAENSNWHGIHALHDLYAAATGAAFIAHGDIVPEADIDAAIRWAKGGATAHRARQMNAELSPETRQVMLLKGMIGGAA